MKIFQVVGYRKSGKTTTIERLIKEMKKRGYTVGTVKSINCPVFSLDGDEKSNTHRHAKAGADVVVAFGRNESDFIYPIRQSIDDIFKRLENENLDYLIVEGGYELDLPRIVCAERMEDTEDKITDKTFAIYGKIANNTPSIEELTDIIISKVNESKLPVNKIPVSDTIRNYCQECKTKCNLRQ